MGLIGDTKMDDWVWIECRNGRPCFNEDGSVYGLQTPTLLEVLFDGAKKDDFLPFVLASKVDELATELDAARARIGELEASVLIDGATLAEQHKRIAELERAYAHLLDELAPTLDAARAEVPAWCHDFMARIARSWDDDIVDEAAEVVHQYADQLRACGIEPTT